MRLTEYEQKSIKKTFKDIFGHGKIYLFGSRVDDNLKGGDIDLYLVPTKKQPSLSKKIMFLIALKEKIGEQKIDVVLSCDTTQLIEQEALSAGVVL